MCMGQVGHEMLWTWDKEGFGIKGEWNEEGLG